MSVKKQPQGKCQSCKGVQGSGGIRFSGPICSQTPTSIPKNSSRLPQRGNQVCAAHGVTDIRTGKGSIQMCCFLASHVLFLLTWMPLPYFIHLTNYDSTFRVQLTDPSSAKPFLTFKLSSEWKKSPSYEHLYYCTHQLL